MLAIISLLIVVTLSILITRIATVALSHTGLSREAARFQARSAFTGAGFTTHESEKVVNHPVRRRIVMMLMLLGNAGIVTAVSSLILTFVNQGGGTPLGAKIVLLVSGLLALYALASSRRVDRYLSRLIERALKTYTRLDVRDYASLMRLEGEYRIVEHQVQPGDWMADKPLKESQLRDEGIIVLGVRRDDGTYIGAPHGDTRIRPEDVLTLYGRASAIAELDERRADLRGDLEHRGAVAEQEAVEREEEQSDRERQEDGEARSGGD